MNPLIILVAVAGMGIEAGWEPLPTGGHEYTVQIEPQLLDLLKRGNDEISSEVPPQINVRRYRITVGTGKLARVDGPPANVAAPSHVDQPPQTPSFPEPPETTPAAPPEAARPPFPSQGGPTPAAEPSTPAADPAANPFGTPPASGNSAAEPPGAAAQEPPETPHGVHRGGGHHPPADSSSATGPARPRPRPAPCRPELQPKHWAKTSASMNRRANP